jgi:hypothetical protein
MQFRVFDQVLLIALTVRMPLNEAEPIAETLHNTERYVVLDLAKDGHRKPASTFRHPQTMPCFLPFKNQENRCLEPLFRGQ